MKRCKIHLHQVALILLVVIYTRVPATSAKTGLKPSFCKKMKRDKNRVGKSPDARCPARCPLFGRFLEPSSAMYSSGDIHDICLGKGSALMALNRFPSRAKPI